MRGLGIFIKTHPPYVVRLQGISFCSRSKAPVADDPAADLFVDNLVGEVTQGASREALDDAYQKKDTLERRHETGGRRVYAALKKGISYQVLYAHVRLIFNNFRPFFLNFFTGLIHRFFRTASNTILYELDPKFSIECSQCRSQYAVIRIHARYNQLVDLICGQIFFKFRITEGVWRFFR
jgi:hypothetical protein